MSSDGRLKARRAIVTAALQRLEVLAPGQYAPSRYGDKIRFADGRELGGVDVEPRHTKYGSSSRVVSVRVRSDNYGCALSINYPVAANGQWNVDLAHQRITEWRARTPVARIAELKVPKGDVAARALASLDAAGMRAALKRCGLLLMVDGNNVAVQIGTVRAPPERTGELVREVVDFMGVMARLLGEREAAE